MWLIIIKRKESRSTIRRINNSRQENEETEPEDLEYHNTIQIYNHAQVHVCVCVCVCLYEFMYMYMCLGVCVA